MLLPLLLLLLQLRSRASSCGPHMMSWEL